MTTTTHCPIPETALSSRQLETVRRPRIRQTLLWAAGFLLVGFLPAALMFTLNSDAAAAIGLDQVPVPAALFIVVWIIVYPSMGVAASILWQRRSVADACVPLAVLIAGFLQTTAFWFTDSIQSTAVTDATGLLLAATTVWVVSRTSLTAARWLLPWLVWMPITLTLKLLVLAGIV
jgi:benzodiazapine receptor